MKRLIDRRIVQLLLFVMALFVNSASAENNQAAIPATTIVQLTIQDAIGPATSDYIERSMDKAAESGAKAVLITLDTPGGLDTSMRQIIRVVSDDNRMITKKFLDSKGQRQARKSYL
ncbi:hypothetical protein ABZN20_00175 [Methylococcus sp. ANG]|uniref:hypothetical protein n=1 Tax=Methylococcus sp. ANG TaxID=3231903 RepID=UPI003458A4F1